MSEEGKGDYTYDFPRPAVAADVVLFGYDAAEEALKLFLIKRSIDPFLGKWALPGGFVGMEEAIDEAASRKLKEEGGLEVTFLEQLYTFGDINRDPRGRVITIAYYA
ncbi:MAG: NUDIX hydrolase, partial [Nitrospinota bacterium]|nr:NUDIX hydrolase [Nitrospinota bacterium]